MLRNFKVNKVIGVLDVIVFIPSNVTFSIPMHFLVTSKLCSSKTTMPQKQKGKKDNN